jgi:hypothetical protein
MTQAPSDWLDTLATQIAECLVPASPPTPLAAHVQSGLTAAGEPTQEVSLFYGAIEVVGGPHCGERADVPFWIDLLGLARVFDRIGEFSWQTAALGADDDLGPHVAIEGAYDGLPVRVRVLATAPSRFPATRTAAARQAAPADRA